MIGKTVKKSLMFLHFSTTLSKNDKKKNALKNNLRNNMKFVLLTFIRINC